MEAVLEGGAAAAPAGAGWQLRPTGLRLSEAGGGGALAERPPCCRPAWCPPGARSSR